MSRYRSTGRLDSGFLVLFQCSVQLLHFWIYEGACAWHAHMPPERLCMCRSPNILLTEGPSHKRRAKLGDVGLARTLQTPPTVSDALQVGQLWVLGFKP